MQALSPMYRVFLSLVVVVALSGCAANNRKLERSIEDIRAYQREQMETINSLDSQVKMLAGRVEQLEFGRSGGVATHASTLQPPPGASTGPRGTPPLVVPLAELEEDEVWANGLPAETAQIFVDALGALREGRFVDAVPLLQAAAEQTDTSDAGGVVLFWEGIAYDGLNDNKNALKSYVECSQRYPKVNRAPGCLARQADVLLKLGDRGLAKDSLKKLMKDYPKTAEAAEAREKLKGIK
jgi:TolA-binding protein